MNFPKFLFNISKVFSKILSYSSTLKSLNISY
jgi:hypothetical protein